MKKEVLFTNTVNKYVTCSIQTQIICVKLFFKKKFRPVIYIFREKSIIDRVYEE